MNGRKTGKIIAAAAGCMLLLAALRYGIGRFGIQAEDAPLPDRETVDKDTSGERGSAENPLFILEIVPDETLAEIGWLIPGCEPIGEEGMKDLAVNKKYLGTYCARFTGAAQGKSPVVDAELKTKQAFADELEEGSKVCANGVDLTGIAWMLPDSYEAVGAEQNAEYGVWVGRGMQSGVSGYYEKTEPGQGYFRLETTDDPVTGELTRRFLPEQDRSRADYIWHTAENTQNIPTDYTSPQVWTKRDGIQFQYTYYELHHNDDLIRHAFEKNSTEFHTVVKTMTPVDFQNPENLDLIDQADMIYLHRTHDTGLIELYEGYHPGTVKQYDSFAQNDLTWDMVTRMLERQNTKNPAALILDYKAMYDGGSGGMIPKDANIRKLFLMMTQFGPRYFKDVFWDAVTTVDKADAAKGAVRTGVYQGVSDWEEGTFLTAGNQADLAVPHFPMETGVVDHVYTYDGDMSMLDQFLQDKHSETADHRWEEVFDYYEKEEGERPPAVSPNDIIKYLFQGFEGTRTTLRILELQPCNKFIYGSDGWKAYYRSLFPWFTGSLDTDVAVKTMPTWQLNGSMEDLNAAYDMIIVGENQDVSNGLNQYRDTSLNMIQTGGILRGVVYNAVGDIVAEPWNSVQCQGIASSGSLRYSGNDITKKKEEELKGFMDAKKPVVMAAGLYDDGTSNPSVSKFDKSSYMYETACLYQRPGTSGNGPMFVKNQITVANGEALRLKKLLAKEICRLEFAAEEGSTGYPTEYGYQEDGAGAIGAVDYWNEDALIYRFRILGDKDQRYGVRLYEDMDADGIYSGSQKEGAAATGSEELKDIQVTDPDGSAVSQDALQADIWYTVSKPLDDKLSGIIPWKLEVYDTANPAVRDGLEKCTAVRAAKRQKVKVLQMNLTKSMTEEAVGGQGFFNLENDEAFQSLLKSVREYSVDVDYLENQEWSRKFLPDRPGEEEKAKKIQEWQDKLDEYDMLVLGFGDECMFTDNEIFYTGFQDFVNRGKSVILSHDMGKDTSYRTVDESKVTDNDAALRDLLGQRRFKEDKAKVNGSFVSLLYGDWEGKYDDITQDGRKRPGLFDNSNRLYAWFGREGITDRDSFAAPGGGPGSYQTRYLNLNNRGQITQYPFAIPELIEVSDTHAQNYQLDMEKGDEADNVVWFTMTDAYTRNYREQMEALTGTAAAEDQAGRGLYSSRESDGANSYYLYTRGNITYTGLGHHLDAAGNPIEGGDLPQQEVKLFINTLLAAFRASAAKPGTEVLNPDAVVRGNETTLYITLDQENMSSLYPDLDAKKLDVSFQIKDDSAVDVSGRSYTIYFTPEGDVSDQELLPITVYEGTPDQGRELEGNGDNTYEVERDGVYSFQIPYSQIVENGGTGYRLVTKSSYVDSKGKTINTKSVNTIHVYIMGLFNLN